MRISSQDNLVPNRTGNVLFPILTVEDARAAVKIAYLTAFGVAGVFALLLILDFVAGNQPYSNLFDVVLIVSLGLILKSRPSRFAAMSLFLYSFLVGMPLLIHIHPLSAVDGNQILISLIFLYGTCKGLQGTFGYHRLMKTKVDVIQLIKLGCIIFLYLFFITIMFIAVGVVPPTANALENIEDHTFGSLWLMTLIITIFAGSLGRLPGTRINLILQKATPTRLKNFRIEHVE